MSEKKSRSLQLGITLGFVIVGILGFVTLKASKPQLEKSRPPAPVPPVWTTEIKTGSQPVRITGDGTVRPLREIKLVPQVSGKVVHVSPSLVDGGEFNRNDILLRIDPVDYQLAVTLAAAQVKDAESRLQLAEQEAEVAREEWLMYPDGGSQAKQEPPPLVVKEPQLAAAQAALEAARADLERTRLHLGRTQIKAPFDGRVSEKNVDIGQYVAPGQPLAALYSTDAAEIVVPLEDRDLFWFHVPGFTPGDGAGAPAKVRARIAGQELSWPGRVVRSEGKLDERTRMINVVVRVDRPYAAKPPLAAGLFVAVYIEGRPLLDAALIPRAALRQDDMLWVVDHENRLHFRKTTLTRLQEDEVIVKAAIRDGDRVVVSPLKGVTDGMEVRVVSDDPA